MKNAPLRRSKKWQIKSLLLFAFALSSWLGYRQIKSYFIEAEAIFVLGGDSKREIFAAQLASKHPNLPIWVSSGSPRGYVKRIFINRGIKRDRLHLDYRAVDTVTNFTTLADELKAKKIESVYLVTSASHMTRARVIAEIVFGSRGIVVKPISVATNSQAEPVEKSLRDGARAVFWLMTGYTGASFKISQR